MVKERERASARGIKKKNSLRNDDRSGKKVLVLLSRVRRDKLANTSADPRGALEQGEMENKK